MSSANLLKGENGSFSLFSKTGKSINTGLNRVESESVVETLKAVKSGI